MAAQLSARAAPVFLGGQPAPAAARRSPRPLAATAPTRAGLFDGLFNKPAAPPAKSKAKAPPARTWVDDVRDERKGGKGLKDAQSRRARVSSLLADPVKMKAEKERQREAKKAMTTRYELGADESQQGRIIIPMAPFGMPEYDEGERFDLKGPYVDSGYVAEDADFMGKLGRLFGGGKRK